MSSYSFKNYYSQLVISESVSIQRTADKALAVLTSHDSAPYTKLANNIRRLAELEAEVKELKESIKTDTRDHVQALFEAEDVVRTRIVETVSFTLTLSKDPKASETFKYKEILDELAKSFTPELIQKMTDLKKTFKSVTQKPPSLKLADKKPLKEEVSLKSFFSSLKKMSSKFMKYISSWSKSYDKKLASLKQKAKAI
jgi:hypothetical protein